MSAPPSSRGALVARATRGWVPQARRRPAPLLARSKPVHPRSGADWNHALSGKEWTGSVAGRQSLLAAIERLKLYVPTASSPHQIEELLSIDHIAVPESWVVSATQRHRAFVGETRISDHDAYVVEASPQI